MSAGPDHVTQRKQVRMNLAALRECQELMQPALPPVSAASSMCVNLS